MAVPGPFNRIARAGGQKVTIRTLKRPLFRPGSAFNKKIFNDSSHLAAIGLAVGKDRKRYGIAPKLALEG